MLCLKLLTGSLPSLNEYIEIERGNRYAAAAAKKKANDSVAIQAMSQTRDKLSGLYDVSIYWTTPDNRQDPDNVYFKVKFILDGLVQANILLNDGRKNIRNILHYIETKNELPENAKVCFSEFSD